MITLEKIKIFICFSFVMWMLCTSVYSWLVLGKLKHQTFLFPADTIFLTDTQATKLFQRERGGVRRVGGNLGRNTTKLTYRK